MNDDSSFCVVVMDYKMKFETMKHLENAVEDFGKRGLSWHGVLVFYYVLVYVEPNIYEMRQDTIHIDHTNALDNK